MAKYKDGDEGKAIPMFLAALIVIAATIASFIFGATTPDEESLDFVVSEEDGVVMVNPGGALAPDGPPSELIPDGPPL